ncbi:COG3014 family protein [Desulfotalea psychrophila]|nr:hypothetical protein [Desulfotalea psychrophila]
MKRLPWYIIALYLAISLGGCGATLNQKKLGTFNQHLQTGRHQQALDLAMNAGDFDQEDRGTDLLWDLQAGNVLTLLGQFKRSNYVYDQAELLMKDKDTEGMATKGVGKIGSMLINNSVNGYQQTVYDSVMINTYKGLNDILLHDWQNARVEFNRAADRQRRAKEHFKKKIAEQEKRLAKEEKKSRRQKAGPSWNMRGASAEIDKNFTELNGWKAYGDYINPYTDYLHGLFFMLAASGNSRSDYDKAVYSFKRVAGTHGRNKVIKKDLYLARKLQSGQWRKNRLSPRVWVIFENGLAPTVDEIIIPVPLFLVTKDVDYVQIALPKIVEQPGAYPNLQVSAAGKKLGSTQQIASIDRVVESEFKKEYPYKVTEALISAAIKGTIQYVAEKEAGDLGSILSIVYQAATTHADTRSWTALPKEVQALQIKKPKCNSITLSAKGMLQPVKVALPKNRFSIVHVRAAGVGSQPTVQVVGF